MRTYEVVFTRQGVVTYKGMFTARNEVHAEFIATNQAPRGIAWDVVEATAVGG